MAVSTGTFGEESTETEVGEIVRPVQMAAGWDTMIAAGGMDDQDAATITNPTTEITGSDHFIMSTKGRGTVLRLTMGYVGTPTTDAVIKVFGRFNSGAWQTLVSKAGNITETLTSAPSTDVTDGTLTYTNVSPTNHAWDLDGCNQVLVGVQTALAGGTTASAVLYGKII